MFESQHKNRTYFLNICLLFQNHFPLFFKNRSFFAALMGAFLPLSPRLGAGFALFAAMEALVLRDNRTDAADKDVTCVIILGAGVNGTEPSLMLATRLRAALDFVADRPDVPIICSGGQGAGENITEAECMARWIGERGVAEERIWKEEESTSTRENFDFSTQLMAEHGIDPTGNFAFVTNDYHVARAKRIAGVPWAYGVAATLPRNLYYDVLQLNYYIREAFAMAELLVTGGKHE